jgi:hypothetical protein
VPKWPLDKFHISARVKTSLGRNCLCKFFSSFSPLSYHFSEIPLFSLLEFGSKAYILIV